MADRRATWSWALYDLANTIFSFNILSFYFPVWAKDHLGAADAHLSIAFGASMLAVAFLSPVLGGVSDEFGRRIPFLVTSTALCVAATVLLGTQGLVGALVLYAFANLFFQLGLVFYDALLPDVSERSEVGTVGGAGVGIGYFGSFAGLGIGAVLLSRLEDPHPWIFAATGAFFLLVALPCFLFVRERRERRSLRDVDYWRVPRRLSRTFRDVFANKPLFRFLVARFIYADSVNTMIIFMGIYATREADYAEEEAQFLLGAGIGAAILGGFVFGRLVDRLGARRILMAVLFVWMGALALAAAIPLLALPREAFWGVAVGSGVALGGTWAADRPLMLRLTPEKRVGEFYGVYGMVGRFAAVAGPLIWALVVDGLRWGRPVAVLALLFLVIISALVLRTVPRDEL
ncbi:MAG: MFS transporter [Methanobacteriota archaeon]